MPVWVGFLDDRVIFEELQAKTYGNPANLKLSTVGETPVREQLGRCLAWLEGECRARGEFMDLFELVPASLRTAAAWPAASEKSFG